MIVGAATDAETDIGPLIDAAAVKRYEAYLADAEAKGRTVVFAGEIGESFDAEAGHYVRPALVTDSEQGDRLVQEEQFLPILPIVTYDSLEEAVQWCNDSNLLLTGSVWGSDLRAAQEIAAKLQSPVRFVNRHHFSHIGVANIPFG